MEFAAGDPAARNPRGIFRRGAWAFVEDARGERQIVTCDEYEAARLQPPYDRLKNEDEYHESVLAHRRGEAL